MADESYVQVSGDGTGKKVRNLVLAKPVRDGVPDANADQNRYVQVVALADADGRLIQSYLSVLTELLAEQRKTNELLEAILGEF